MGYKEGLDVKEEDNSISSFCLVALIILITDTNYQIYLFYFYYYNIDIDMFNLSTQASAYFIIICVTTIINLICFFIMTGMWGFVSYLIYSLVTFPLVLLWLYNIECLTTGNCHIWSWVITVLTLISVLTSTIMIVAISINPPAGFASNLSSASSTATTTSTTSTANTTKDAKAA